MEILCITIAFIGAAALGLREVNRNRVIILERELTDFLLHEDRP